MNKEDNVCEYYTLNNEIIIGSSHSGTSITFGTGKYIKRVLGLDEGG